PIATDALTILINLSIRPSVLRVLATDDEFLEALLARITNPNEHNADLMAMLLANLAKADEIKGVLTRTGGRPLESLSTSENVMDQLVDCFVKGADAGFNKTTNFEYLAYFFADLAKFSEGQEYFLNPRPYDSIIPLSKLIVFTEHASTVRRKGVASTVKVNLLPYILLPLAGPEDYDEEDSEKLLPELQLLPKDKRREAEASVITTHVETLLLLSTTREGREALRQAGVYYIVRETHLHVDDEAVRDACDRLVQLLMADEEKEDSGGGGRLLMAEEEKEGGGHGGGGGGGEGEGEGEVISISDGRWVRGQARSEANLTKPADRSRVDGSRHDNSEDEDEDEKMVEIL
ncbi:MAG: hypothetical protein M1815_005824, partial [Lichina confinis]